MQILKTKSKIHAPIEHVYEYISDSETVCNELSFFIKKEENSDLILKKENDIILFSSPKESLSKIYIKETKDPYSSTLVFEPIATSLQRFGEIEISCHLNEVNQHVILSCVASSNKTPSFIWRIFIKLIAYIMLIKTKNNEKLFIERIEQAHNKRL